VAGRRLRDWRGRRRLSRVALRQRHLARLLVSIGSRQWARFFRIRNRKSGIIRAIRNFRTIRNFPDGQDFFGSGHPEFLRQS
jgi:hypothetical protein